MDRESEETVKSLITHGAAVNAEDREMVLKNWTMTKWESCSKLSEEESISTYGKETQNAVEGYAYFP